MGQSGANVAGGGPLAGALLGRRRRKRDLLAAQPNPWSQPPTKQRPNRRSCLNWDRPGGELAQSYDDIDVGSKRPLYAMPQVVEVHADALAPSKFERWLAPYRCHQ